MAISETNATTSTVIWSRLSIHADVRFALRLAAILNLLSHARSRVMADLRVLFALGLERSPAFLEV